MNLAPTPPIAIALRPWVVLVAAVWFAGPAQADRPSLIDLKAALDAHITPPPTTAAGSIRFADASLDVTFELVDLALTADVAVNCTASCIPGLASFAPVRVTVEQSSDLALLIAHALPSGLVQDVLVAIPSQANVLRFQNAQLQSTTTDDVSARVVLEFDFDDVQMEWLGGASSWNVASSTGSGCTIPANEVHIELAGNAASNLQPGEIASTHRLGLTSGSALPTLTLKRTPPNPCYVRTVASAMLFDVELRRLWTSNDLFPTSREFVEEITSSGTIIDRWTLRIEAGALREEIDLHPAGQLTIRSFSPVDGSLTTTHTVGF